MGIIGPIIMISLKKIDIETISRFTCVEAFSLFFFFPPPLLSRSMKNEEPGITIVEDVPFSCCTNKIVEPCGHRDILQASRVCNFDPNKVGTTVWNVGCRSIILTHARIVGYFLIFCLSFLSIYQVRKIANYDDTQQPNDIYIYIY